MTKSWLSTATVLLLGSVELYRFFNEKYYLARREKFQVSPTKFSFARSTKCTGTGFYAVPFYSINLKPHTMLNQSRGWC